MEGRVAAPLVCHVRAGGHVPKGADELLGAAGREEYIKFALE